MNQCGASDLHLKAATRPRVRIHGRLVDIEGAPTPGREELEQWMVGILSLEQQQTYFQSSEMDFAYHHPQLGRYRCNYFRDMMGPAAAIRRIQSSVPSLEELELPPVYETFVHLISGLVLVAGATGSGKSTTLAALIDAINHLYTRHIISLEDPVEYLHESRLSLIHQRALRTDFPTFADGIRAALRQDPNILLIGEMRDVESIRMALTAAETGLLVFATVHTNDAPAAIDRIIDVFQSEEQPQVRSMLSTSLAAVACQTLLKRADKEGLVPATEVLMITGAASNVIREGKSQDLQNLMQTSKAAGMHPLDDSLERLLMERKISGDEAFDHAVNKGRFARLRDGA